MSKSILLESLIQNDKKIKDEITWGNYNQDKGNFEKAAEHYKGVGKELFTKELYKLAIEYYELSSSLYLKSKKYLKAINIQRYILSIYEFIYNTIEQALITEKIASWYKYYLHDLRHAGYYYHRSAKLHEEKNHNYSTAYKKAIFASECFDKINLRRKLVDSLGLATRMAIQAGYDEKAGEAALKWLTNLKKDYSSHYLSVCIKGYIAFSKTNRLKETYFFLNEVIKAHYEYNKEQKSIVHYLTEAQKIYIKISKKINSDINIKITTALNSEKEKLFDHYLEMMQFCEGFGLKEISEFFFISVKNTNRIILRNNKKYVKYIISCFWRVSSKYGTSFVRWFLSSVIIIFLFGTLYSMPSTAECWPEWLRDIILFIKPEIKISSANNWFSPFYFSYVIFTTLGFGDITPSNLQGQVYVVFEVLLGYIMLGGLISIFSRKFFR